MSVMRGMGKRDETDWRWEDNAEDGGWGGGEANNIRETGKSLWEHYLMFTLKCIYNI